MFLGQKTVLLAAVVCSISLCCSKNANPKASEGSKDDNSFYAHDKDLSELDGLNTTCLFNLLKVDENFVLKLEDVVQCFNCNFEDLIDNE